MINKRQAALELYNNLTDQKLEELPAESWKVFKHMSYKDIAKPLIILRRLKGQKLGQIKRRFDLSERQIVYIFNQMKSNNFVPQIEK